MPVFTCKVCKRWYRPSGNFPWDHVRSGLCQICYYSAQEEATETIKMAKEKQAGKEKIC